MPALIPIGVAIASTLGSKFAGDLYDWIKKKVTSGSGAKIPHHKTKQQIMNYSVFKITENEHGYFFFIVSPFEDADLAMETAGFYVSNSPQIPMCQYLMVCDWDNMNVEKVSMCQIDVINKTFQPDDKNMLVSSSFVPLIPPPKKKREAKPKADKPAPKPKGKKAAQKVEISTEPTTVNMN